MGITHCTAEAGFEEGFMMFADGWKTGAALAWKGWNASACVGKAEFSEAAAVSGRDGLYLDPALGSFLSIPVLQSSTTSSGVMVGAYIVFCAKLIRFRHCNKEQVNLVPPQIYKYKF